MQDTETVTLLFVCRHGAARSVVAAEVARRLAARRGAGVRVLARGIEPADATAAAVLRAVPEADPSLARELPRAVSRQDLAEATRVVTFDLEPEELPAPATPLRWDGVPAVSEDPAAARAAIERRVGALLDEMARP